MSRPDEGTLRKEVEQTADKVAELRAKYAKKRDERVGRALADARAKASEALAALWAAFPEEKPPSQSAM